MPNVWTNNLFCVVYWKLEKVFFFLKEPQQSVSSCLLRCALKCDALWGLRWSMWEHLKKMVFGETKESPEPNVVAAVVVDGSLRIKESNWKYVRTTLISFGLSHLKIQHHGWQVPSCLIMGRHRCYMSLAWKWDFTFPLLWPRVLKRFKCFIVCLDLSEVVCGINPIKPVSLVLQRCRGVLLLHYFTALLRRVCKHLSETTNSSESGWNATEREEAKAQVDKKYCSSAFLILDSCGLVISELSFFF